MKASPKVSAVNQESLSVDPVLRWAGGKRWLVSYLDEILRGLKFDNYIEPFFGGGAIFFKLINKPSILSDINSELINTYIQIKKNPDLVIHQLKSFPQSKEYYLKLREQEFEDKISMAARFIFLNKTSFNGLYRVNSKGKYNVPYGNKKFSINELASKIYLCSKKLNHAELIVNDFEKILNRIKPKSLVYLDPPYTVTHNSNGFTKYNEKIFSLSDQIRLSQYIDKIDSTGAKFILSNADHKVIDSIFLKNYYKKSFSRSSVISGLLSSRGQYDEVIITNIKI